MTGNNYLLDTNIIIHAFKKKSGIAEKLDGINEIYVSVITVGELYYGAYKSAESTKHLQRMLSFLDNCIILSTDTTTSDVYGNVKTGLSKKGKPIPENDIWIAAAALQHDLQLLTMDNHFKEVDNLKLQYWE